MANILIVEDEPRMRRLLEISLGEDGHNVQTAGDAESGLLHLRKVSADLVVTDLKLPGINGLEFLQEGKRLNPALPFIVMTAYGSVETAVDAMKAGASDYVLKPFTMAEMKLVINKELDVQQVRDENVRLKEALGKRYHFQNIVGRSKKMQEVLALVARVAPTNSTVLIGGESGVGKDLIARAIHQNSRRASGPFIKINSTAIPDTLFESELFGFERGAFTGALASKPGKFELADKGTLFLDEIGDMSLSAQAKVLRALQEGKITRVGGEKEIAVDVRVVAATNKDLLQEVENKTFRLDLYHRLGVILIHVPSLNERRDDVPLLVEKFLEDIGEDYGQPKKEMDKKAIEALQQYNWTGNIRELRNMIERLIILSDKVITDSDVKSFANPSAPVTASTTIATQPDFDQFKNFQEYKDFAEREYIKFKLEKNNWNVSKTADDIDIQRSHLYSKIEKYALKRGE